MDPPARQQQPVFWRGVARYSLAMACVVAAALLRWLLPGVLADTPYLAFYPAVVAAAAFGGAGPGLLATALSWLCVDLLFDTTPGTVAFHEPVVLGRLLIFGAGGVGISIVAGLRGAAQARARAQAEQLWQSEQRFGEFMDHLPGAAWIKDLQGRYVYANREAQRIFGKALSELRGQTDAALFAPDAARQFQANDARAAAEGSTETTETLRHPDGQTHVSLVRKFLIPGRQTLPAHVGGVALDITERQQAQEHLRASEERFRTVAENAQAVVGIVQGRRFVYANPFLSQISGYSGAEILAMDFVHLVRPDYRALVADYAQRRQRGDAAPTHYEFAMVTKSGQTRWIDLSVGKIVYHGQPGIVGTGYDITERKRAEEDLRRSELRYRTLFDSMDEGFCLIEMLYDAAGQPVDYRFLETNPAFEKHTGLTAATGKTVRELTPQQEAHWFEIYGRVAQTGQPERFQAQAAQLGCWYDVYAFRFGRPEDRQVAVLFNDITARKHWEEELAAAQRGAEQATAAAQEANRAKDHFLAVLSHELRNPLTPVTAGISMLRAKAGFDAQTQETLEMIHRNVELEARLIDDLLDVTRIARGKVELFKSPVELCQVISRAIEVCQPDLEARGLHFGIQWGERPYWVKADVGRLQQVFWNLLKNSIKFTPHGGCVGVRCFRANDHAVVEVVDSGIGIEPEMLPRLFDAFVQAERTITRQFGGLGLGLAISKTLVELHGGMIEAHSAGKGQGALFRVRLPLTVPAGPPSPTPVPGASAAAATKNVVRPLRILLVEDHGDTARVMRQLLSADGHEVRVAGDVATALAAAAEQPFDLVISDLGLPDASGLDLMRELHRRGHSLPGIALSGYGQEQDIRNSREAGFAVHQTKPINADQLREAIAAVVPPRPSAGSRESSVAQPEHT